MSDATARPPRSEDASGGNGSGDATGDFASETVDQLKYIADLVRELKGMSEHLGADTLATILTLAYAEAHQELRRRTR